MENNEESGTTVRGEAVALFRRSDKGLHFTLLADPWEMAMGDTELFLASAVSPRAADAPSEPSEHAMRAVLLNAKAVIQRWDSPLWRQEVHTAEWIKQLRKSVELAESRAADALDSQPTLIGAPSSPEDQAFHAFWCGHMLEELMQPPLCSIDYTTAKYIWDAASRAPAAQAASVPKGWKLVPIEPTQSMCEQGYYEFDPDGQPDAANMWRAMIRATPAPQQEGSEAGNG